MKKAKTAAGLALAIALCALSSCGKSYDDYAEERLYYYFNLDEVVAVHLFKGGMCGENYLRDPFCPEAGKDYEIAYLEYEGYGNPYDDWNPYAYWDICYLDDSYRNHFKYCEREDILLLGSLGECPICNA